MKLVTRFELATKSTNELYGLHRKVFNELVKSKPQTPERINTLLSLENIELEIAHRL